MSDRDRSGDAVALPRARAPRFRIWPPVSTGVPWVAGVLVERAAQAQVDLGAGAAVVGWVLIGCFVLWNGWALMLFAQRRTGLLPGQRTTHLLDAGPYRVTRNPLYVGMLILYVGGALLASSWLALALVPVAFVGLHWGAVLPEERYLTEHLGSAYTDYRRRVRRWI